MDKKKRTNEWGRHRVQILWAFLTNSYLVGFAKGKIYQGKLKNLCVPGLNCYSFTGALVACTIAAMQAVVGRWNFKLAVLCSGFPDVCGSASRQICMRLALSLWADPGSASQNSLSQKNQHLPGRQASS